MAVVSLEQVGFALEEGHACLAVSSSRHRSSSSRVADVCRTMRIPFFPCAKKVARRRGDHQCSRQHTCDPLLDLYDLHACWAMAYGRRQALADTAPEPICNSVVPQTTALSTTARNRNVRWRTERAVGASVVFVRHWHVMGQFQCNRLTQHHWRHLKTL